MSHSLSVDELCGSVAVGGTEMNEAGLYHSFFISPGFLCIYYRRWEFKCL